MRIPRLNALLIPGFVGLGLVSGLLREAVLAYYLGASLDMDIFRVAIGLPLILSDSLAVSFVSVLIPILFSEQKERDAGYNQVMWASILMACCVFAAGALTMPWQARLLAPGISGPQAETLILAGRLCWLMLLFTLLSLPLRAIMSAQNTLWPGASAQFIRSAVFVLGLVVIAALFSRPDVFWITIVAAISGFAVLIVHVVATPGVDRRAALMTLRHAPLMRDIRPIMGVLLVVFATQLLWSGGRVLDRSVASTMQPGLLTSVEYSYAILMAVGALIGTSANIMLAPKIGQSIRDLGLLSPSIRNSIITLTAIATVVSVIMAMNAGSVVAVLLQRGAFTAQNTIETASIVRIHVLSLGPLVLALILTQVVIQVGGQRWLIPIAGIKLAVKAACLFALLSFSVGIAALPISFIVSEVATAGLLLFAMWRRR